MPELETFALKGNLLYTREPSRLECFPDHYLVCENGCVAGIFPCLPDRYAHVAVEDCGSRLIVPGLTDLHLHAPQYAFRGLGMDLELLDWLDSHTFPEESRYADPVYAERAYRLFVRDLQMSTTTRACIFATIHADATLLLMQLLEDVGCLIKRGAQISIKPPEGKRYIRLDTLGSEYDEASLRRTLARNHVHIPKIPRGDFNGSQVKRLIDIETKLHAGKGKGYQVWAERNNIDAKAQMIIFLKEHHIGSLEELNEQIQELTNQQKELKAALREKQNRMKEINRQRQMIRDYSRTKEVYTQYRESGWSVKFYQEHRQEIEDHRNAQAVYSSLDGKTPTLKELTAEYDELKEQKENDQAALDELKPKLTDLKHIRYNYEILERDSAPNSHQHVIPKDHHYDEHGADHDDESR